jgi:hypothetical protein
MLLNYGTEEAGFHAIRRSILNTRRGHPPSNPATYPACGETRQHERWNLQKFLRFLVAVPGRLPGQYLLVEIMFLPYQHVNILRVYGGIQKSALEPSRSAARVRGRDCQRVFPSPIPINYPARVENNSSGVWFGHGNWFFGDTFCSGPHRH